ncbi:hypothetical protein QBC33DRAFT_513561 [Phialemonium atrogriseum]|uniref:Zinc finger CHCC-type domain-containing protein n=1 Tax=Phialemonium atrogriseum TaxID=1093897 RepID=A0AAJ0FIY7_9PEZI|nr:uncharacterized protein QBC33DRAFT_513561 [Phialemonium atrogriseum]KAK1769347.1 hypothetical protein QBC33DRAFT_513561 [Phialemonium atrogriseum]
MSASRLRSMQRLSRQLALSQRAFATTARQLEAGPAVPAKKAETAPQVTEGPAPTEVKQAPNRADIWAPSQRPRSKAMTGPRFEQTNYDLQPQPYAAIELIHQQPVRWTHERVVVCEGGGGPAGHPKIYINTDKPEISTCNYCGLPFANEHHRKHLESMPVTSYPL